MGAGLRMLLVAAAMFGVAALAGDPVQVDPPGFVLKAAMAGMTEVTLGNVALSKTQDAKVKQFAQRMVTDHGKANEELKRIATGKGFEVPNVADAEHQKMVLSLGALSGSEFDRAYASHMVSAHTDALALFEAASKLPDAELAAFANSKLPTIREHKQLAEGLAHTSH